MFKFLFSFNTIYRGKHHHEYPRIFIQNKIHVFRRNTTFVSWEECLKCQIPLYKVRLIVFIRFVVCRQHDAIEKVSI